MMTPTQRSLKHLRDAGWTAEVVERWNPHVRRRKDLFGFADIVAMKAGETPLLVQTTAGASMSARLKKIIASETAEVALNSGFAITLHGWRKLKLKRGGKAMRWCVSVVEITPAHFNKGECDGRENG